MTDLENETAPRQVKYALFAHERGTDYYVLVTENGNLLACGQELIERLRFSESLISFDTVAENILKQQEEAERMKIVPPGTVPDHFARQIKGLLEDALRLLDLPPKENVDFFSLPQDIVETLHWTPRQKTK
ncbi:MAG: hypothetical protein M1575_01045 [Patescibacteria group bacterium]|nr:hypothetical protein [Patescibacteria group bacterium]MCL5095306.1 hypothetical protein [Patescibacteria group bacterium]